MIYGVQEQSPGAWVSVPCWRGFGLLSDEGGVIWSQGVYSLHHAKGICITWLPPFCLMPHTTQSSSRFTVYLNPWRLWQICAVVVNSNPRRRISQVFKLCRALFGVFVAASAKRPLVAVECRLHLQSTSSSSSSSSIFLKWPK